VAVADISEEGAAATAAAIGSGARGYRCDVADQGDVERLAAAARQAMAAHAQDPDQTARLCLEGILSDAFMIIADPSIRSFASDRHREVEAALDHLDARLASPRR
jgi:hypothetical protein